jgi:HSP20 family protein
MTLTRLQKPSFWSASPIHRVAHLRQGVDSLFTLALNRLLENDASTESVGLLDDWYPAVDLYEDKENLVVKAEVPGMKKEDIEITLNEGVLHLSGERKQEKTAEAEEKYCTERWLGHFHRSFTLPCRVNVEKLNATYVDGMLTVTLPKAEEAKPKLIPITIQ